jgi:hypothetical protein
MTQTKVASEQALAWSGLLVVIIRPNVFLEGFFLPLTGPTVRDRGRIELPFGSGKTSPVPRRMSLGSSPPSSPTLGRSWAGSANSPVRGRRTCTGSPGGMKPGRTGEILSGIDLVVAAGDRRSQARTLGPAPPDPSRVASGPENPGIWRDFVFARGDREDLILVRRG